ncbi:MAG: ATP-binding protein, partial [Gemmatimonadales bacterium]
MRLPLFSRGRVVGVVTLGVSRQWGRRLGTGELAFAQELVSRVGLAVDNARLRQETEDGRRRFQLLFEANPIPMWVFDAETLRFLAVNRAAVRHYGYSRSEFLSMTIMDIRPPDDTPGLNATLERGPHPGRSALTQHQGKDGRLLDMELISERLQFDGRRARLVLATDISDRTRTRAALQQTEDQLRQVQRLDTMGRLASGVAYDFNNLLTTIHGFSDLLLRDLPADDGRRADVEQIRRAADRGALLARQLTAFGGKPAMPPRALSLNEVVDDLDDLLQRLVGADVRLETRLAHGLPQVRMDQGQLEQIIVNLALNARDAMPAGGTLTIETAERQISASAGGHVRPGWYAVLGVSDTGAGMDEEALARTFEPSYTSPASGDGARSGLGLSIVYRIVRRAGGVVRVSSEPGQGTTV